MWSFPLWMLSNAVQGTRRYAGREQVCEPVDPFSFQVHWDGRNTPYGLPACPTECDANLSSLQVGKMPVLQKALACQQPNRHPRQLLCGWSCARVKGSEGRGQCGCKEGMVGEITLARAQSLLLLLAFPPISRRKRHAVCPRTRTARPSPPIFCHPHRVPHAAPVVHCADAQGRGLLGLHMPNSQHTATSWQKGYSHGPARGYTGVSDKSCHGNVAFWGFAVHMRQCEERCGAVLCPWL